MRSLVATLLLSLFVSLAAVAQPSTGRLGPSLKDKASQALQKKDLKEAASLYEAWLQAEPRDNESWYNLACIQALSGEKEKALEAWENAVEAGWRDGPFAEKDDDLASIREETRFRDGVKKIAERTAASGPKGFIRHYLSMQSRGTYIVMLPPDYETSNRDYPICVILHGSGSVETAHGRLADEFGREGVIYVAPRAPYASPGATTSSGGQGYTSWPPERLGEDSPLLPAVRSDYVEWIFSVVQAVQNEYRARPGKVFIYGHSQGGGFATLCALTHPDLVASIFVQAGSSVPESYFSKDNLAAMKRSGLTAWICHGTEDNVVPPTSSTTLADRLKTVGIEVTLRMVPGDHSIAPSMREIGREWKATIQ